MVKAGIVGGTGDAGVDLLRLLAQYPQVELTAITGQAAQNMNIMFGLPETMGLEQVPMVP